MWYGMPLHKTTQSWVLPLPPPQNKPWCVQNCTACMLHKDYCNCYLECTRGEPIDLV